MVRVNWTLNAQQALQQIWNFHAQKNPKSANNIAFRIVEASLSLIFQEQYQIEESLGPPYRRIICGYYKIIYIANKNTINILTVFDCRRNPNKLSIK